MATRGAVPVRRVIISKREDETLRPQATMKKIEAIIQPHKLEDVKEALKGIGIDGMTISEVRGHGRQKGHKEVYRGMEYQVDLLPKVKIEMVVSDERSPEVIQTVVTSARTGKIGDGKVFVYEVAEAIRIRNGDHGDGAL
jgi:nitrogen regulatory protein P-II 1